MNRGVYQHRKSFEQVPSQLNMRRHRHQYRGAVGVEGVENGDRVSPASAD